MKTQTCSPLSLLPVLLEGLVQRGFKGRRGGGGLKGRFKGGFKPTPLWFKPPLNSFGEALPPFGAFDLLRNMVMWETQQNNADYDYFKILTLQETLKTPSQHQEEFCAFSEAEHLCQ